MLSDVYLMVVHDDQLYFVADDAWTHDQLPWATRVPIAERFNGWHFSFPFPIPEGAPEGSYTVYLALVDHHTGELASIAPIEIEVVHHVQVSCSLNAAELEPGDLLKGFMSVHNRGVSEPVDLFAMIIVPDGSAISLTQHGFATGVWPWHSDLILPAYFAAGPDMIFEIAIPADAAPGSYIYRVEVRGAGEGEAGILSVDECLFDVTGPNAFGYYADASLGNDANDGFQHAPWKTITHALDSVEGSEENPITIHVASGKYSASTNGETFPLTMKSWVSLSGDDRDSTILDAGDGSFRVICCDSVDNLSVRGFTITGGWTPGGSFSPERMGGGIRCWDSENVVVSGNRIASNRARDGGGICCYESSHVEIRDNVIADNNASYGGGIRCSGDSSVTVADNHILNNHADSGGGFYFSGRGIIERNIVVRNTATGSGGGLYCTGVSQIRYNRISMNSARDVGGGIYTYEYSYDDHLNVTKNLINDNWAWSAGGGIGSDARYPPDISYNTIVNNACELDRGAGIGILGGYAAEARDCIIRNDGDDLLNCTARYCCISDTDDTGTGIIHADPMFVSGPLGDYYLHPNSPCVDAGSRSADSAYLTDRTTQADGSPDTNVVDLGFHYTLSEPEVDLRVSCSLNGDKFMLGDVLRGFMSIENRSTGIVVDVFTAIMLPDGSTYSLTQNGLTAGTWPWYSALILPSGFAAGPEMVFEYIIPRDAVPGSYSCFVEVCRAGEASTVVLARDECAFEVIADSSTDRYVDAELGDDSNDGSEHAPWKTITHALDMVAGAEEAPVNINVAAGTYSASTNGESFPLNMKSWVSLIGENRETTILDAEMAAFQMVRAEGVESMTIEGFTITGGYGTSEDGEDAYGAGIACRDGSLTVKDNIIHSNSGARGGGIYCYESTLSILGNTIADNSADHLGGGIICYYSTCSILDNVISGNSASSVGGGVFDYSGDPLIMHNTFMDNSSGHDGGAIYCAGSVAVVSNNLVVGNKAEEGGGIMCEFGAPVITNNTIVGNEAEIGGGMSSWLSSLTIRDCVFWDNGDDINACTVAYCCIQDPDPGQGNIHDDPMLVTCPLGEYYLHPDSPCIDAGSRSAEEAGLSDYTTQTDGTPDTGTVDMGFHYPLP